jgi:pyruvate,water dikinase
VSDDDLRALATIGKGIEKHYGQAMDIEWAIDRRAANSILLLQARPETVWSNRDKDAVPVSDTVTNPLAHVLRALSNRG